MSGEADLNKLVATMRPELRGGTYVFVTVPADDADPVGFGALMSFREDEEVRMIVPEANHRNTYLSSDHASVDRW
jgi:hypothetical protein